jgi:RNA polymerase subunit RPABC4/transcription elongation factor Spt4
MTKMYCFIIILLYNDDIKRKERYKRMEQNTKFCKHCGEKIDIDCVVCPKCGKQVEDIKNSTHESIIINNSANSSSSSAAPVYSKAPKAKNKWVSFFLCLFLGWFGVHKFYEGKILFGILYLLTFGLFGVGVVIDLILIILKPNPYYV